MEDKISKESNQQEHEDIEESEFLLEDKKDMNADKSIEMIDDHYQLLDREDTDASVEFGH